MNIKRDEISRIAAEIHGVSPDYVRKIRRGERENEEIFATVMDLVEGRNRLIEEVKLLDLFLNKPRGKGKTTLGKAKKTKKGGEKGGTLQIF